MLNAKYTVNIIIGPREHAVEHANVESFNLTEGFLMLHKAHGSFGFPLSNIISFKAIEQAS